MVFTQYRLYTNINPKWIPFILAYYAYYNMLICMISFSSSIKTQFRAYQPNNNKKKLGSRKNRLSALVRLKIYSIIHPNGVFTIIIPLCQFFFLFIFVYFSLTPSTFSFQNDLLPQPMFAVYRYFIICAMAWISYMTNISDALCNSHQFIQTLKVKAKKTREFPSHEIASHNGICTKYV